MLYFAVSCMQNNVILNIYERVLVRLGQSNVFSVLRQRAGRFLAPHDTKQTKLF